MNKSKIRKIYENYNYEEEYNNNITKMENYEKEILNKKGMYVYIVKTIVSGDVVEKEIYPGWKNRSDIPRSNKEKKSRKEQEKLNRKNRIKKAVRMINTNFNEGDLYITLSYEGEVPDKERAKKDVENYLDRIRRWWKKNKPNEEFKYVSVLDFLDDPSKSKRTRIHHHLIISRMDRNIAEEKWGKGTANANRLQADNLKFTKVATYIASQAKTRIGYSKNLKKPTITINRTALTRRKVEQIAINENLHKEYFENNYKDLNFIEADTYISKQYSGVYIHAKFRKREKGGSRWKVK